MYGRSIVESTVGVSWAWSKYAKMDSLLQGFQNGCSVSFDVNDPIKPHPRFSEFKFKREGYGDQESRRRKLMEEQKSRRREYMDYARMITEGQVYSDEDNMEEEGIYIWRMIRVSTKKNH